MHYALCIFAWHFPPPELVPSRSWCIPRFMHCQIMHFEKVYCTRSLAHNLLLKRGDIPEISSVGRIWLTFHKCSVMLPGNCLIKVYTYLVNRWVLQFAVVTLTGASIKHIELLSPRLPFNYLGEFVCNARPSKSGYVQLLYLSRLTCVLLVKIFGREGTEESNNISAWPSWHMRPA